MDDLQDELLKILSRYKASFQGKVHGENNNDHDLLMDVFGITPELKRENRQYWGRELGYCWQLLIIQLAKVNCSDYKPAIKMELDEPIDLFIGKDAIDTKYRIGSGDSGTLKKFKAYGKLLRNQGYNPVLLILRNDNLPAAITAVRVGGWDIYIGEECFNYLQQKTNFDIRQFLYSLKGKLAL